MRHADFRIGAEFRCGGWLWRCTDIGTRTIVAIRIDRVEVGGSPPAALYPERSRSGGRGGLAVIDMGDGVCGRAVEDDPGQPGLRVMIVSFTR